jgi:SAM-dependent methyltransferase
MELFGVNLALPDFPRVRSIRGIGTSDPNQYASRLAEKLDYRNTFFNREPRFDIMNPAEEEIGKYDFLISSEVFEHVMAPVEQAFRNVHGLLKPSGVAVFTVPYSMEESMREHFPDLHQFGFAQVGDGVVLINRTRQGEIQVFEEGVGLARRCGNPRQKNRDPRYIVENS